MAPPVFPASQIPGIGFPGKRSPEWKPVKQDALSGKRVRTSLFTYPIYNYELPINFLRTAAAFLEWQTLVGFINQLQGPVGLFAFDDVTDDTVTAQGFGTGDGTTVNFQLIRSLGGFAEPVFLVNGVPTIYVNGTPTAATISATGVVTFGVAPAPAASLTWTGNFYWPCRFDESVIEITKDFYNIYSIKSLKFSTEKLP